MYLFILSSDIIHFFYRFKYIYNKKLHLVNWSNTFVPKTCKALFQNMVKHRQGQTSVDRYVEYKTQEYSESKRGSTIGEQYPTGQGREIIQVYEQ